MAAQPSQEDFFSFVGGLNTEGGYFLTPKNSWKEGDNVIPQKDGSIQRRNAIDLEQDAEYAPDLILEGAIDTYAYSVHTWENVDGDGNKNIIVAQYGPHVYFYDASASEISKSKYPFYVDLSDYKAFSNESLIGTSQISCASCYGKLIITNQDIDPIIIEYVSDTTITQEKIDIKIRDLDGIKSPVDDTIEKTQAEWEALGFWPEALYNLYNQGWNDLILERYTSVSVLGVTITTNTKFPSNTKQWIRGKNTNGDFENAVLKKQDFGSSLAPKGRVIIDAFKQDRVDGLSKIDVAGDGTTAGDGGGHFISPSFYGRNFTSSTAIDIVSDKYRPSVCAFYAGRVWYSGVPSGDKLGWVMFSQIMTDTDKAGKCYQQNDPTSEIISDLLDTDGGVLQIPEAGTITGLVPLGKGLLVLALNGAWLISGADTGFTATKYAIDKVSENGCISQSSIVKADEFIYYFGYSGIFKVGYSEQTGMTYQSLSDTSIRTYYLDIPIYCRKYTEGKYNSTEKIIYWLYSENELEKFRKNKLLCFDVQIGCFYTQTIASSLDPTIISIGVSKQLLSTETSDVLLDNGTNVLDDVGSQVVATTPQESAGIQKIKFGTITTTGVSRQFTFSEYSTTRTNFNDWVSYDDVGQDVASYVITGYNLASVGPTKAKTGHYLTAFMKRTEQSVDALGVPITPSSCLLQTRWDFTDNAVANKWSSNVQLYRINRVFFATPSAEYEDGYPLVITKNKLRGRGKSIQMKYSSEPGNDMQLVGWSATFVGNTNV